MRISTVAFALLLAWTAGCDDDADGGGGAGGGAAGHETGGEPASGGGGAGGTGTGATGGEGGEAPPACVDEDGDGFGVHCAAGPDCDDGDDARWQLLTAYVDGDGDGYMGTAVDVCSGDTLPPGSISVADDCDDADDLVHPESLDLPDDGIDQDCDGDDFEAADDNGFFVDGAGGDDTNAGTKSAPLKTIGAALALAGAEVSKRRVYVATGDYPEALSIGDRALFGGYEASTWTRDLTLPTRLVPLTAGITGFTLESNEGHSVVQGFTVRSPSNQPGGGAFYFAGVAEVFDCVLHAEGLLSYSSVVASPLDQTLRLVRSRVETGAATNAGSGIAVNGSAAIIDSEIDVCPSGGSCAAVNVYQASLVMTRSSAKACSGSCPAMSADYGIITLERAELSGPVSVDNSSLTIRASTLDALDALHGELMVSDSELGTVLSAGSQNDTRIFRSRLESINATGGALALIGNVIVSDGASAVELSGQGYIANNTIRVEGEVIFNAIEVMGGIPDTFTSAAIVNNDIEVGATVGSAIIFQFQGSNPPPIELRGNNLRFTGNTQSDGFLQGVADLAVLNDCQFAGCVGAGDNISVDPLFVSSADFHLSAGSPNIDAGVNPLPYAPDDVVPFVFYDSDGELRPAGPGWDIGALEAAP